MYAVPKNKSCLTFIHTYLPGFKSGGPVRSLQGIVENLGDEFDFYIVTSDRDSGDKSAYPGVPTDRWVSVGNAKVFYTAKPFREIARTLSEQKWDLIYCHSFFNFRYTLLPLIYQKLGILKAESTLIAPRGEFSPGAIRIKRCKKMLYVLATRALGIYKNVHWQASTEHEKQDINREIGFYTRRSPIYIASNIPPKRQDIQSKWCPRTENAPLRVLFLSRIAPKKNLEFALQILATLDRRVQFDIFGPIDRDLAYWDHCQQLIREMPSRVETSYRGPIEPATIPPLFDKYDLLLFPTKGENFGHIILESLQYGCPVLTSDATPWTEAINDRQLGWALPLDSHESFGSKIEMLAMEPADLQAARRQRCRSFGHEFIEGWHVIEDNVRMFRSITAATS